MPATQALILGIYMHKLCRLIYRNEYPPEDFTVVGRVLWSFREHWGCINLGKVSRDVIDHSLTDPVDFLTA